MFILRITRFIFVGERNSNVNEANTPTSMNVIYSHRNTLVDTLL